MILNDKLYTFLKWLCLIFLPAISTLYFALANVWGFPYAEQIVGTISAIGTFLGCLIGVSQLNYDGEKKNVNKQAIDKN